MLAEALFGEAIPADQREYVQITDLITTKPDKNGKNNAIRVKQWRAPHARAELVRRSICERAILQAVGRVRPLQRTAETPVRVIVFTDTPVPELGEVIPRVWSELRPPTDEVMAARYGTVLENSTDAANAAPDVVTSAMALKKDRSERLSCWMRGLQPSKGVVRPEKDNLGPSWVSFSYQEYTGKKNSPTSRLPKLR